MNEERRIILQMLEAGDISVEEAESLLEALDETDEDLKNSAPDKSHKQSPSHPGEGAPGVDFSDMKDSLKGVVKGIESVVREAVQGIRSSQLGEIISTATGFSKESVKKELVVDAADIERVSLKSPGGDIRVTGTDTETVTIQATVTARGSDSDLARSNAEGIEITAVVEGNELMIRDSAASGGYGGGYRIEYEVQTPRSVALAAKCTDGDLQVESIVGGLHLSSLSGDVYAKSCAGGMILSSKSGDVELAECDGTVTAKSLSGDVSIGSMGSEKIHANSLSGDIACEIEPIGEAEIVLRTLSGDVDLTIPETAEVAVEAHSLSGEFTIDLPLSSVERSNHSYVGVLNAPTGTVTANTKSGDVFIH